MSDGSMELEGRVVKSLDELVEKDAHAKGLVPDPRLALPAAGAQARQAWWQAAEELRLDVSRSDQSLPPGRWRRLALYGHLDHDLATLLTAWSQTRDLLQHAYSQRNVSAGREVWESMQAFRARVTDIVDAVIELRDRCAAAAPDG